MYKIYLSTFSPFWNNSDINYPDFEKFDTQDIFNFESASWTEIPNGTLQWIQSNSAWVQIDPVKYQINYLGVLDTHTNKKYYFFVIDEFDRTINTIKLNLELDNWLTYGKNMLNKLKGNNAPVYFNKKHMNRYGIVDNFSETPGTEIVTIIQQRTFYNTATPLTQDRVGYITWETGQPRPYHYYISPSYNHDTLYMHGGGRPIQAQINFPYAQSPRVVTQNQMVNYRIMPSIEGFVNDINAFMNENNITDKGSTIEVSYSFGNEKIFNNLVWAFAPQIYNYLNFDKSLCYSYKIPATNVSKTMQLNQFNWNDFYLVVISKFDNVRGTDTRTDGDFYSAVSVGLSTQHTFKKVTSETFNWGSSIRGSYWGLIPTFSIEPNAEIKCIVTITIRGTKPNQSIVPKATTYNMNLQTTQQHLLNECDFTEYGNNKINLNKQNYKIPPNKIQTVELLYSRTEPLSIYNWQAQDDSFFSLENGYYLYGVVKYPLTPSELDQNMIKFLGNDISSTLNVFLPIQTKPMLNNPLFKFNTKGLIESSFGDLLTGIIASPISPTSLSTKCVTIKTLFNKPPYNPTTIYHQMSGFALNAFELKQFQESSKTPYGGDMFKPFTPPTTEAEKWDKKLTTLDWRNETLLLAPQFLEYYLTNGTNQININNFVNSQLTDKNYMYFSWALTPLTCILYIGGLFDVNRFETQKNIITYSGSIPANSASYNQWVLNNSASINMGLESAKASRDLDVKHAKQNQVMGALNSVAGIAAGIAGGKGFGAAMGIQGVMQGLNQAHQAKQSIEKADLTYKNYQSTIAGANLDAQTKTTAISSDDATYINTFAALSPLSMIYKGLKVSDCQAIWYSCLLSGYNVNNVYNFNEYDNRTFYNYLKVTDIAGQVLQSPNTPLEYKEWFISKLTSGVRLWKTNMNYQLDNKENFIDRIDNAIIPIPPTTPTRAKVTTLKKGKKKNGK